MESNKQGKRYEKEIRGKGCRRGMKAILHDYNRKSGWNGNMTEMKEDKEEEGNRGGSKKIKKKEVRRIGWNSEVMREIREWD